MMTNQRGVKKLPERKYGPFVVRPLHDDSSTKYARLFVIQRECTWSSLDAAYSKTPESINALIRRGSTFAENLIAARALFYLERRARADVRGVPYHEIPLSYKDPCTEAYHYFHKGIRRVSGLDRRDFIERALAEMKGDA